MKVSQSTLSLLFLVSKLLNLDIISVRRYFCSLSTLLNLIELLYFGVLCSLGYGGLVYNILRVPTFLCAGKGIPKLTGR